MTTRTKVGTGRWRIVSGAIFLFISYFHTSTTVSAISLNSPMMSDRSAPGEEPLTAAESSSPPGVPVYQCAQSGRRGCPVETERPKLSIGRTQHVRDKRSSDTVDDPVREGRFLVDPIGVVRPREALFRPGDVHGRPNRPNRNKLLWNVPFRTMFRNEKSGFKFGKRFSSDDLDDELREKKRSSGSGDSVPIKFGRRRRKNTDCGMIGPEEDVPDTEHKKSVVFVGTKTRDFGRKTKGNSEIGSKRKFKFGRKKSDPEEEEEDGGEIRNEEKRRIMFGKRGGSRFHDVDEPLEDFPDPVETKRRRKFHFG